MLYHTLLSGRATCRCELHGKDMPVANVLQNRKESIWFHLHENSGLNQLALTSVFCTMKQF